MIALRRTLIFAAATLCVLHSSFSGGAGLTLVSAAAPSGTDYSSLGLPEAITVTAASDATMPGAGRGRAGTPLQNFLPVSNAPNSNNNNNNAGSSSSSSSARTCPATVPGGLDCTVYSSLVSAAAAAAVSATQRASSAGRESLVVRGSGSASAAVTRAQFTVTVEVSSQDVFAGALQDITTPVSGPYGDVERWSRAAAEQAMDPARKKEVLFCASCTNREAGRRVTSVLNYLAARNASYVAEQLAQRRPADGAIAPPRTTSMSLSPEYEYRDSRRELAGYRGRTTVSVDVPVALAAEVLDGVLASGATSMSDVKLAATPAAVVAAQLEADRAAALAAVDRAQNVLSALHVTGTFPLTRVSILGAGAAAQAGAGVESSGGGLMRAASFAADSGNIGATVGDDVVVYGSVEIAVSFTDNNAVNV